MNKKVPQSIVLHALLSELCRHRKNVNGNSKFCDLTMPIEGMECIRLRFSEDLGLPEFPYSIVARIPTFLDMQDETPPFNPSADMGITVRSLSISITLWYMENHPKEILALTSN